jgi:hypothetical protein
MRSEVPSKRRPERYRPRKTPQAGRVRIDCPNEDHRPAVGFHVDRMHWRSAQSIDKMRSGLGGYVESICNTRPSRGSNGSGSKQPVLWYVTAGWRSTSDVALSAQAKRMHHRAALAIGGFLAVNAASRAKAALRGTLHGRLAFSFRKNVLTSVNKLRQHREGRNHLI